ncbi:MAG: hypothetical protein WBB28_04720 [Crinalium sp.]
MLVNLNMQRYKYCAIALLALSMLSFHPEQATATPTVKRVNLTGKWIIKTPIFYSNAPRTTGCRSGAIAAIDNQRFSTNRLSIIQKSNGTVILSPFRSWVNLRQKKSGKFYIKNPKLLGKIFTFTEVGGGFTEKFKGTLSKDGKKIIGHVFCQHTSGKTTATGTFTLTRIVAQPPKKKPQAKILG